NNGQFGYMAGLGYTYFFNYHWGLGVGAEFSALRSSLELDDVDNYYAPAFGGVDRPVYLRVDLNNYEETYKAFYINIPIMAKYQVDAFKQHKFYAAGGFKLGIPVKANYSAEGSHKALAYDVDVDGNPMGDAMSGFHGLGVDNRVNVSKKDLDLKFNLALSLESGIKWKLGDRFDLYTGLFVDYGLLDVRKDKDLRVADYFENADYNYAPETNAVLSSVYGTEDKKYTKRVNTFSAGIKVQLAFGLNSKVDRKEKERNAEKPFEGVTPEQMEKIMKENTDKIVDVIEKNFEELRKQLEEEAPELFDAIPTDEIEAIVQFDFDKDDLKKVYIPGIDNKIEILKKYPEVRMMIIGHTDNRGTKDYNHLLGLHRAQAVKNYMVEHGIAADRLFVVSKGDTAPVEPNTTEENRYKNRRVEFEMIK
ncbi:OmpA family protein, partial [Paludibacteraceae bacterium OttesenSCG-928-F17]|nr:OmpA family protein [Paludibacteraceae bacterium OttesenSCG-928-F17]